MAERTVKYRIPRVTPQGTRWTECTGYWPDASGQQCACGMTYWAHNDKNRVPTTPAPEEGAQDE